MRKATATKGGYTLLEVLVAFAILGAIAVPLAIFLSSVAARSTNDALLDAAAIARNRMEELIAQRDFSDTAESERSGDRSYLVETKCQVKGNLLEVFIEVKKADSDAAIFTLYRSFYAPSHTD